MVHEKKNSRVSLCAKELFHPQDSLWIIAAILVCRNTGFPVLVRDPHFYLVLGFRLVHVTTLLMFQKCTGFPYLSIHTFTWHEMVIRSCASTIQSLQQILFPLVLGLMAQASTYFPKVRRMLLYFSPLIFWILLAILHAASRAHRSCHSVSSWERSSKFGALGLRWWGSPGQITPSDGFWSRMLAWRTTAFMNRTHRIGFRMFEHFRKIDKDFSVSISWSTQPNCRVFFNIATALLSPFFPVLLPGCSSTWRCA